MIKVQSILFILFLFSVTLVKGQDINKLLVENRWSAYDNFAVINFFNDNLAEIEYAYCSYCQTNKDTLNWHLSDKILVIGEDSLVIKSASRTEISTFQNAQSFLLKNVTKLKPTKLKKNDVQQYLMTDTPLYIKVNSKKFDNANMKQPVKFNTNGKMWLDDPKYRGQWAIKSFYGDLFLVYLHRMAVNRNFPLLKINSLKKNKMIVQPIPSIKRGAPFVVEIGM